MEEIGVVVGERMIDDARLHPAAIDETGQLLGPIRIPNGTAAGSAIGSSGSGGAEAAIREARAGLVEGEGASERLVAPVVARGDAPHDPRQLLRAQQQLAG
jgi:hypothetical protein